MRCPQCGTDNPAGSRACSSCSETLPEAHATPRDPSTVPAPNAAAPPTGHTGKGPRFTVVKRLGRGGMGEVFQCFDLKLERTVAIKRLHADLAADPSGARRFQTEAKAIASLNHPNVVQIHDISRDNHGDYIVMEFVPGESLAQRLERAGRLDVADALVIMTQVARALSLAHGRGSSTGTSSPRTSSSRRTASRNWPTSASPSFSENAT